MMYNTGNPVGSTAPKDLYDNSQVLDRVTNSNDLTTRDRLQREILTLKGMASAAGDATIAIDAAQRALNSADASAASAAEAAHTAATVEENAEEIAETAAASAVAAVSAAVSADADRAEAAAEAAETARDVANVSANIYPTISAGLAATALGGYFSVPAADAETYLTLYREDAGPVATKIADYPSAELLRQFDDVIDPATDNGYAFDVADPDGRVALGVKNNGAVAVPGGMILLCNETWAIALTDENGRVGAGIRRDGTFEAGKVIAKELQAPQIGPGGETEQKKGNYDAELNFFPAYGQSWAVGFDNTAISLSQRFDNLSFNAGVRSQSVSDDPAVAYTSLIPLVERTDDHTPEFSGVTVGETPVTGQTDFIKELIQIENSSEVTGLTYQMLGSAPGEGSKTIGELSKPSTYFTRLVTQINYGFQRAQGLGKPFSVQAVSWAQGGGADATYGELLEQLRVDLDTDAKSITGQSNDVKMITWQLFPGIGESAATLYRRYVQSSEDYPNIFCACPTYFLDQVSPTNLHLTNTSTKWLGAYYGLAYKRVIIDGGDWEPLKPKSFKKQGSILSVTFNPVGSLTLDTDRVALTENYGFELYDSLGVKKVINSVSISSRNTVKILAALPVQATDRLVYGFVGGTSWGRTTGRRGNLRDSQGDNLVFDGGGLNLPMHNWCVVFDKTIG